jgi:hypothetical protein
MKRATKIIFATASLSGLACAIWLGLLAPESPKPVATPTERSPREQMQTPVARAHHEPHAETAANPNDPMTTAYASQMEEVDSKLEKDPIARRVPMLFDKPKKKQLETLQWMLDLPPEKLVSAIPEVAQDSKLSADERRTVAVQSVRGMIDDLRAEARR